MKAEAVVRRVRLPVPVDEAFAWHARPGALERLLSPWERVEVLERSGGLEDARATLRVGRLRVRITLEHRDFVAGRQYRTVQTRGPFARWDHLHTFEPAGAEACTLEERVEVALPGGVLGRAVARGPLRRRIERALEDRQRRVALDLAAHREHRTPGPLRVLVSGAGGMIGSALVPFLSTGGHAVFRLVRREPRGESEIAWDPRAGAIDLARVEGFDAVVHLAGEGIGARWSEPARQRMVESRVAGTGLLARSLARLRQPPRVLVAASAVGFYGDRGDLELTEDSDSGEGFLAELARQWEAAAEPARAAGIRVVHPRFGVVLTPQGGALARLLLPFRLGLGGRLGSGRQWWSWISLDDLIGVILHALTRPGLGGPVNTVSPRPVTQAEFARVLGEALGRPAVLPAPALALRALLGTMADEVLLASQRVLPSKLARDGFAFRDPELGHALRWMLGRPVGKKAS